ncbi:hypothetical protein HPB48_001155 [Haemaphysalis longicornis]|uniref:Uncharacterized protein n=1 Tax=Haemaphysalis longicornis TaxID=44386 RepID=A0A9J6FL54_HAELO|nr:hypothetical protein HPB48_001155 [Haemaphysalis longicornis]
MRTVAWWPRPGATPYGHIFALKGDQKDRKNDILDSAAIAESRRTPRAASVLREKAGEQCGDEREKDDQEADRRNGKNHGALGDARPLPPVDTLEACDKAAHRKQMPIPPQPPPSSVLDTPFPPSGVATSMSVCPNEKKIPATGVLPADSVPRQPGLEQRRRALINANSKFNRLNSTTASHLPWTAERGADPFGSTTVPGSPVASAKEAAARWRAPPPSAVAKALDEKHSPKINLAELGKWRPKLNVSEVGAARQLIGRFRHCHKQRTKRCY